MIGSCNRYNWLKREITLTPDVAAGREPVHVLIAAHELAHSQQSVLMHTLRFLHPVRWLAEMRAWESAVGFLSAAWSLSKSERT